MNPELIQRIADQVAEQGADEYTIGRLRDAYPDTIFSLCSDDDVMVNFPPAAERDGFNVYLIDAGSHCLTLTNDPETSSGLVFATVEEDE